MLKYFGSLVAADEGCERDILHIMNKGYKAWGVMQSVLNNGGLVINAENCLYEGVIVPTALKLSHLPKALNGTESWGMRST